jgi:hypothetical protein
MFMKKVLLSFALFLGVQFAFAQCDGVILKEGSASFRRFTNGMQVNFDFCGSKDELTKIIDETSKLNDAVKLDIENDPSSETKYNCILTIRGDVDYNYAVKMMNAMGIQSVTKNGKKLSQSDAENWYK